MAFLYSEDDKSNGYTLSLESSDLSFEKSFCLRPLVTMLKDNRAAFIRTKTKKMVKKVVIYRISLNL